MAIPDNELAQTALWNVVQSSQEPIVAFTRTRILFSNAAYQKLTTLLPRCPAPGDSIFNLFGGDSKLLECSERALNGEQAEVFRQFHAGESVSHYRITFRPVFFATDERSSKKSVMAAYCTWHDVTELDITHDECDRLLKESKSIADEAAKAFQASRESEEKFRIVAENARAVFGIVQGRHFVYANPYLLELSGYSKEEILTVDIETMVHPDSRAMVLDYAMRRQGGEPVPQHYEFAMVTKSGEKRWMDFSPALSTYNGKPAIVGTAFDITDRKRAEELLIRSEKLASVGRMAATIAHEINNPLSAVMNCIFLARQSPNSTSAHRFLDAADEELRRIAHITQQALGFYRESAAPAAVSLRDSMESTLALLKSKIKAKHVRILKEYAEDPVILAIAGEIRQVLANLLANSLEAVHERGTIRIRVSNHKRGNIPKFVRITIADNGAGICDDVRPRIFEPLFTTRVGIGTGLGLWVTKEIVDKHHGSIRVHSRVAGDRQGTTFSIVLPAA